MIELPHEFVARMNQMLGEEAPLFWESYRHERAYGLRINRLKLQSGSPLFEELAELFSLAPVPWCRDGYYYDGRTRPGKHPYHAAGLYYIQEPSAMSAVELLDPQPGEAVLDLAAAPGGKSTQIGAKLEGRGLLIANEIHPLRAKILSAQIERFGIANAVVANESPQRLAERFPAFFDKVMVDAPCSGEGMFRKDSETVSEWSLYQVERCAARQQEILEHAAVMVKPGGILAYSTCTFSTQENEGNIEAFLKRHSAFELIRMERIWPHREHGEGHFVALLRNVAENHAPKRGRSDRTGTVHGGKRAALPSSAAAMRLFESFRSECLSRFPLPAQESMMFGEQLYLLPSGLRENHIRGLKVLRPGLHLARVHSKRIEPAHALAMAIRPDQADHTVQLEIDSQEVQQYLNGQVVPAHAKHPAGWVIVTLASCPLGWGKSVEGAIKNHLPKGLRLPEY